MSEEVHADHYGDFNRLVDVVNKSTSDIQNKSEREDRFDPVRSFRPVVRNSIRGNTSTPYGTKRVSNRENITVTERGVFAPALSGANTFKTRVPQMKRKSLNNEGAPLPIDQFVLNTNTYNDVVARI